MRKPETMMIDDVKYVREDSINPSQNVPVAVKECDSIASAMIGKFVIVRSSVEGVNAGTVLAADETGVQLGNCRRLYYHKPADKSVSWYEGVAQTGLGADCRVSGTCDTKLIVETYSMTLCTYAAQKSIMEYKPNAQG